MAEFDHKSGKIPPKAEGLACMHLVLVCMLMSHCIWPHHRRLSDLLSLTTKSPACTMPSIRHKSPKLGSKVYILLHNSCVNDHAEICTHCWHINKSHRGYFSMFTTYMESRTERMSVINLLETANDQKVHTVYPTTHTGIWNKTYGTWSCLADVRSPRLKACLTRWSTSPSYDWMMAPSMPITRPSRYVSSLPSTTSTRLPNFASNMCMLGKEGDVCLTPRRFGMRGSAVLKKSTLLTTIVHTTFL